MKKKTSRKPDGAKSVKDLSRKSLNAKTARAVTGGKGTQVKTISWASDDESPKETVTFEYGVLLTTYKP